MRETKPLLHDCVTEHKRDSVIIYTTLFIEPYGVVEFAQITVDCFVE